MKQRKYETTTQKFHENVQMISARLLSVYVMMALMAVSSYALQGIIGLQGINEEVEKEISDMGLVKCVV
ncbi:hypothetical protein KIN20_024369 [Parelaphostrongylus tenuis]|uniref:Uncharacterized protein n=1 Tax=Parelaphostrongylus tenuis TaxID=148309 RepID=A0AAD5MTB4_PARTN|nr:hypothetical protein KIN20_024369 [Parelaphostrongylus tenuis]